MEKLQVAFVVLACFTPLPAPETRTSDRSRGALQFLLKLKTRLGAEPEEAADGVVYWK